MPIVFYKNMLLLFSPLAVFVWHVGAGLSPAESTRQHQVTKSQPTKHDVSAVCLCANIHTDSRCCASASEVIPGAQKRKNGAAWMPQSHGGTISVRCAAHLQTWDVWWLAGVPGCTVIHYDRNVSLRQGGKRRALLFISKDDGTARTSRGDNPREVWNKSRQMEDEFLQRQKRCAVMAQ